MNKNNLIKWSIWTAFIAVGVGLVVMNNRYLRKQPDTVLQFQKFYNNTGLGTKLPEDGVVKKIDIDAAENLRKKLEEEFQKYHE